MNRRLTCLAVAFFGFLLSHFIWYTAFDPPGHIYPVTWQAPWITYPHEEMGQSYFRKKIYLSGFVRAAWLKVMALDDFKLYVNGVQVSAIHASNTSATAVVDISQSLHPGLNLIGVATTRVSYPGNSQIVVEGRYTDWQGREGTIFSDETWKVAPYREKQIYDGPDWYDALYDDHLWKKAKGLGLPKPADNSKVDYPPFLYTEPFKGRWGWVSSTAAKNGFFRYTFERERRMVEGWVRVAADGGYVLFVNGVAISKNEGSIGLQGLIPTHRTLGMYNVTSFLRQGRNVVAIAAFGERSNRTFGVDGVMVDRDGTTSWFGTGAGWRASSESSDGWSRISYDDSDWSYMQPIETSATLEEITLTRKIVEVLPPPTDSIRLFFERSLLMIFGVGAMLGLWAMVGHLAVRRRNMALPVALSAQTIPFVAASGVLLAFLLLGYDIRFGLDFPYRWSFILLSLCLLFLLQAIFLLSETRSEVSSCLSEEGRQRPVAISRFSLCLLILIIVVGFFVRVKDLTYRPLTGDEVTMGLVSVGIFSHGYPAVSYSPLLPVKFATTSELVYYPMALSIKIFGLTELGVTLPEALFGTAMILILYLVGRRLFDGRVGLLAAGLYAFLPFAINVAQYARYPSQLQFFSLLTVYLFYLAIERGFVTRYLYWAFFFYALTYLSWEGSAFLVPALFAGVFAVKRRDFSWLKEKHFWFAWCLLAMVVFLQLSNRYLINKGWLSLGSGIGNISLVALWNQPLYDPWVYYDKFLVLENIQIVSLFAGLGLFFCKGDRALSYVSVILLTTLFLMTNFLETQSSRHVYHLLPLLILSASRTFWILLDRLAPVGIVQLSRVHAAVSAIVRFSLVVLLMLTANGYVLKLYNMPGTHDYFDVRLDTPRSSGVKQALLSGKVGMGINDEVLSNQPQVTHFYLGRSDFYSENNLQIPVAIAANEPLAVHRLMGAPLVYNLAELKDVLAHRSRFWIIVPAESGKLYDSDFINFLDGQMRVTYEDATVTVYLWEH